MNRSLFEAYNESPVVQTRIADTQGEIYQLAHIHHYDIEDFSKYFLQSDFCRLEMDAIYSPYQTEFAHICFEVLFEEFKNKKIRISEQQEPFLYSPVWIGRMYRFLFYELKLSSKELYKKVPFQTLAKYSIDCEDMSEEESIVYLKRNFQL